MTFVFGFVFGRKWLTSFVFVLVSAENKITSSAPVSFSAENVYTGFGLSLTWVEFVGAWFGGSVVRALDSQLKGREFDSRPVHCQVATLSRLFSPVCLCIICYRPNRRECNGSIW